MPPTLAADGRPISWNVIPRRRSTLSEPNTVSVTALSQQPPLRPIDPRMPRRFNSFWKSAHIDCVPCFGDTIAILSLGGPVVMTFQCAADGARREMALPARSLLTLSGSARYDWLHAIPARKSDTIDGVKTPRVWRVSLTFRSVNIGA